MSTTQDFSWAPQAASAPQPADLRVVRGQATDEEIAALFAVILAEAQSRQAAEQAPPSTRSEILRRAATIRGRLTTLPGLFRRK
ncbi:acyl-CoA carboxylase subunit epsilon [Pseudoglutamicibacter cumminsii]|uniref:acyl-CoA carboxylase subunit epsilon n=1 Tax=Pseudoglutamicibacter cumminsii TaxID=156979 RepID=UPI002554CB7B|nr:acyl-CoA carboxylase subunit epsilon [Pseudoglutamicibacter cumminsii]MDK7082844.1 acyl-CoA carboxylase subunit epsilon [Pseudoglutamicibacter cumminsii]